MKKRSYVLLWAGLFILGTFILILMGVSMTGNIVWEEERCGDANGNGYPAEPADVISLGNHLAGTAPTVCTLYDKRWLCDVNDDGYVNLTDYDLLLAVIQGNIAQEDLNCSEKEVLYECTEDDGGNECGEKGIIIGINASGNDGPYRVEDNCEEGNLTEYYCETNSFITISYECNSTCEGGVCSCIIPEEGIGTHTECVNEECVVVEGEGLNECNVSLDCANETEELEEGQACVDTDRGVNYFERGEVYLNGSFYKQDECVDNFTLEEIYCDGEKGKVNLHNCSLGCNSGKCTWEMKKENASCLDSDEGIDYFEQGSCSDGDGSPIKDFCLNENNLGETSCNNESKCITQYYSCQNGCFEGACKEKKQSEKEEEGIDFSPKTKRKGLIEIIIEFVKRILMGGKD